MNYQIRIEILRTYCACIQKLFRIEKHSTPSRLFSIYARHRPSLEFACARVAPGEGEVKWPPPLNLRISCMLSVESGKLDLFTRKDPLLQALASR